MRLFADRRTMLQTLAAAATAGGLPLGQATAGVQKTIGRPTRYDQAMRWIQVAFTEDDPGRYDPQFWLDYFRRIKADGVCLSAGGGIAFYPSKVPHHNRARDLDGRDPFGEMVSGSRALGMSVMARIDPHALSEEGFNAHPEWAMRAADGQPRRHPTSPDLYLACLNGPVMTDFMPQVITEISRTYNVDGLFGNRWGGWTDMCYCDACRSQFKAATGLDIPTTMKGFTLPEPGGPQEAASRAYLLWWQDMRFKQIDLWTKTAQAVKPDLFFVGGPTNGLELDPNRLGPASPIQFIDHQLRSGDVPAWDNGRAAKEVRGFMQDKPVVGIFSPSYRWKDTSQSGAELETWLADGVGQGFRPWVNKFNAKPFDTRWMPVVATRYAWLQKHEAYLRNRRNLARVGFVHSPETRAFYGRGQAQARFADYQSGYYQALIEARIPFDLVDARQLDPAHVGRFRVLVLSNVAALSDAQCQQLRGYVKAGGRIVGTYETSLYDETGARRSNFGLHDLFGCDFAGKIDEHQENSYLTLRGPHPLLAGLDDAHRVMGPTRHVQVTPTDAAPQPLTLVPRYPDQPVERVFPTEAETDIPMVFCRQAGAGRVVYFPMDLDRVFWEYLSVDQGALLQNAVAWCMDAPQPLTVSGAGMIDISLWRQDKSMTAHLVNLTNPMFIKGPIREIIPVGPFEVSLALPAGVRVKAVHLLESGQTVTPRRSGDRLIVTVPKLALHEIVAVDLA